jgi:ribosome-associated protein
MRRLDPHPIPAAEVDFEFSRSSGPGGQNVNKLETRVTLLFDVDASNALDEGQKSRVQRRLATRINKEGVLRVASQRFRTREANRRAAIERFAELLAGALAPRRRRVKTRTPAAAKRRRLQQKRRRSEIKRGRGRVSGED